MGIEKPPVIKGKEISSSAPKQEVLFSPSALLTFNQE